MTASLTAADLQPSLAGRYALERELGHGGMATVFLATMNRHVLKEGGHFLPRPVMVRESLAWLDEYPGPVQR